MPWKSLGPAPAEDRDTRQGGLPLPPAVLPCVAGQGASTRLGISMASSA